MVSSNRNNKLKRNESDKRGQDKTVPDRKIINTIQIEPLEQRVMFSADVLGGSFGEWAADTSIEDSQDVLFGKTLETESVELIFIDVSVPQRQVLIDDLQQQINDGRNARIVLLATHDDGLQVISQQLAEQPSVSAVHIISHGTDQGIRIGNTWLDNTLAENSTAQLSQWQHSLTESADLLIYGCNLGDSHEGIALINTLAEATTADVAASIDSTGHDNLNANWTLETSTGSIESSIQLSEQAIAAWEHELNISLEAKPDSFSAQPFNTPIVLGDKSDIGDEDITLTDEINGAITNLAGEINLINVVSPSNGSITANADDTFTFTPDNNHIGAASATTIVTDGTKDILHHWPLDDNAGGVAVDETGRNDGTIYGTTLQTDGALDFALNTAPHGADFISIPQVDYPDQFTLSFDFRLDIAGVYYDEQFIDQGSSGGFIFGSELGTIGVWYQGAAVQGSFGNLVTGLTGVADQANTKLPINTSQYFDNAWHTYTLTVDSNSTNGVRSTIYIDSTKMAESAAGQGGFDANMELILGSVKGDISLSQLDEHHMRDLRIYEGLKTPAQASEPVLYSDAVVSFDFLAPNNKPALTNHTDNITYIENHDPMILSPALSVEDVDIANGGNYEGATLSLSRITTSPDDIFGLSSGPLLESTPLEIGGSTIGTVTSSSNGQLLLTFDSNATTALINEALQSITYSNSNETENGSFSLQWVYDDGTPGPDNTSDPLFTTVNVIDTPDLTLSAPQVITVTEDQTVAVIPYITHTHDLDPATVLTATVEADNGTMTASTSAAVVMGNGTPQVIIRGTSAELDATLATFEYAPNPDYHGTDTLRINLDSQKASSVDEPNTWLQSDNAINPLNDITYVNDPVRGEVIELRNGDFLQASTVLGQPQELTLSSWVNLDPIPAGALSGAELFSLGNRAGLRLDYSANGIDYGLSGFFHNGDTRTWVQTQSPNNPDTVIQGKGWNHVAYVIADGHQGLYLNGVEVAATTYSTADAASGPNLIQYNGGVTRIGAHPDHDATDTFDFSGRIDNAAIHTRALSMQEIQALAANAPYTGATASTQIVINPVNDAPELTNASNNANTHTIDESQTAQNLVLEPDIQVIDIESTFTSSYNNASLTLERSDATTTNGIAPAPFSGPNPEDTFSSNLQSLIQGNSVLGSSGQIIGDVTNNSNGTLKITFNDNATKPEVDALMRSITYSNNGDWTHTEVKLTWTFEDAGKDNAGNLDASSVESSTITTAVIINQENDDPTLTTNEPLTLVQSNTSIIGQSILEVVDIDGTPENITFQLTKNPANGKLFLGSTELTTNSGSLFFTQQDINDGLLSYEADTISGSVQHSTDEFEFIYRDNNGSPAITGVTLIEIHRNVPSNLSPGISINQDGGNDIYLYNTSHQKLSDQNDGFTVEFTFSELEKNPLGGASTLFSTAAHDNNDPDWLDHLVINQNGTVEWHQSKLNNPTANTPVLSAVSPVDLFDGDKHTVSMSVDPANNGEITLYIDGNAISTVTGFADPYQNDDAVLLIGQQMQQGVKYTDQLFVADQQFSGVLHDVRIWDHVRAPNDIENSIHGRFTTNPNGSNGGIPQKLVSNWQMEDLLLSNGELQIQDSGDAGATLSVRHITDQSSAPAFVRSTPIDELTVLDDATNGSTVGFVTPNDLVPDTNGYTYTINDPAYNGPFAIDSSTGEITVIDANQLNFTALEVHGLPVRVTSNDVPGAYIINQIDIRIISKNEAPVVTSLSTQSITYTENDTPLVIDGTLSVADEELDTHNDYRGAVLTLSRATANIATPNQDDVFVGTGGLSALQEGQTFSYGANMLGQVIANSNGELELAFSQATTKAQFNDVLTSIGYRNASEHPTTLNSTTEVFDFIWNIDDGNRNNGVNPQGPTDSTNGDNLTVSHISSISVSAVNDAPTGTSAAITTTEDSSRILTANDFGFSDTADGDLLDSVIIDSVTGMGTITVNDTEFSSGRITHTELYNNAVEFTPVANSFAPNHTQLVFRVQDDGGVANGGIDTDTTAHILTFEVTPVNDAPFGTNDDITTDEDTAYNFSSQDFGFNDSDGNTLEAIIIASTPLVGDLELNDTGVAPGQIIPAQALADLVFTPPQNLSGIGAASFDFTVRDNGGDANSGIDTSQTNNTLSININAVNDAPTAINSSVTTQEDTPFDFSVSDFQFTDIENNALKSIAIVDLPTNGQLALSGAQVTLNEIIQASEIAALQFTPAVNSSGLSFDSIGFLLTDNGGVANGGNDTSTTVNTINIDVQSVNDAPFSADKQISILQNTSHQFSAADFAFSDIDVNRLQSVVIATLPANGTLKLSGASVAQGQAIPVSAIQNLAFTPEPGVYRTGYDSFAFNVQDDGGTANGGQDTDQISNNINISVRKLNAAPTGTSSTITPVEDRPFTFSDLVFGFVDPDEDNFHSVIVDALPAQGMLELNGIAVTAGQKIAAGEFTNLSYTPANNSNGTNLATIEFRVQDDGGTTDGGIDTSITPNTFRIDVIPVNDAPYSADKIISLVESTRYDFTPSDFSFNDIDGNNLLGITISMFPSNGELQLSGTPLATNQFIPANDIQNLSFIPVPGEYRDGYDSFLFVIQDDGGTLHNGSDIDAIANKINIDVRRYNDPPDGTDNTIVIKEDESLTFKQADFGFTDIDGDNLLEVLIDTAPSVGQLLLNGNSVTSGQAISPTDLGNLVYTPPANSHGSGIGSFDFSVRDDGGTTDNGQDTDLTANTLTIDVLSVNDAPTGTDKTININEDGTHIFVASDFGFSDSDNNFLEAIVVTDLPANGSLTLGGIPVLADQSITNSQVTSLVYTPESNAHGLNFDSIGFTVTDDGSTNNGGNDTSTYINNITINVLSVNDAPVSADINIVIAEDAPYLFTKNDFAISDTENNNLAAVIIESLPGKGSLRLDNAPVTAGQEISSSSLDKLIFLPVLNQHGSNYDSFSFRIQDDGGTVNNGVDTSNSSQVRIEVLSVNDAPLSNNRVIGLLEDQAYSFNIADFSFSDPADNDSFESVEITTLPAQGTLLLEDTPVSLSQRISAADITTGELTFTPEPDHYGAPYGIINFRVTDSGGTTNGGSDSSAEQSLTFNVESVNDRPDASDKLVFIDEDSQHVFAVSDFGMQDSADANKDPNGIVPADNLLHVTINTLPDTGTLTNNGIPVVIGEPIPADDMSSGFLQYSAHPNDHGLVTVTFTVSDTGGTQNGGTNTDATTNTIKIGILSVNDAPVGTDNTLSMIEDTSYRFSLSEFGFSDQHDGDALASVNIIDAPTQGNLTLRGTALNQGATIPASDVAAGQLIYTPPANAHGTALDTITFAVQDSGGTANGGQDTALTPSKITLDVFSANDEPSGADAIAQTLEDIPYTLTRDDFGFTDSDGDSFTAVTIDTTPGSGMLVLQDSTGQQSSGVNAGDIIYVTDIDAGKLVFVPAQNANGDNHSQFSFSVIDNGGTALGGTDTDQTPNQWNINIEPVNDEPAGADSTLTVIEDHPYTMSQSDFGFHDAADQHSLAFVQIVTAPLNGSLQLNNVPVTDGQFIRAHAIDTEKLTYVPITNQNGANFDQIYFKVIDDGTTVNGGKDTDQTPNRINIDITPVNDAPQGADSTVTIVEDNDYTLTTEDFNYSDIDGNALLHVEITKLPDSGTLTLSGSAIDIGTHLTADDLAQGNLAFSPNTNFHGVTALEFMVRDDGDDNNQGVSLDTTPNSVSINVLSVNDAPQGNDKSVITPDNLSYTLTIADLEITDVEANTLTGIKIDTLPSPGKLTLAGQPISVGDFISAAQISADQLVFTPLENSGSSQSSFQFSVVDSGGISNGGVETDPEPNTFTITTNPVNDAPVATPDIIQVAEGQSATNTIENQLSLLSNDFDIDGDQIIAELLESPAHGEFELFSNGTFVYKHDGTETLTDAVTYLVTDGTESAITTVMIDITPVNDAPTAGSVNDLVKTVNEPFSIELPVSLFTDPDPADALTITAQLADGSPLPEWLIFDSTSMTFSGSPSRTETLDLVLKATDQAGALAQTAFTVTIDPSIEPPLAAAIDTLEVPTVVAPIVEAPKETTVGEPVAEVLAEGESAANENQIFDPPPKPEPEATQIKIDEKELEIASFSTEATIFRDFDLLSRSIETHRTYAVNSLTEASAVDLNNHRSLADLFRPDDQQTLNNQELLGVMDEQRDKLQSFGLDAKVISGAVSVSTGLSIGYVIWLVRGGLLIGSVLSTLPAWRNIDPLPVLSTLDGDQDGDDDDSLEDLVEEVPEDHENSEQSPNEGQEN